MEVEQKPNIPARFSDDVQSITETQQPKQKYGLPENFNSAEHPHVIMRSRSKEIDHSEAQRKRRSKNRLSNRRSTGFVSAEQIDEALAMGPAIPNSETGQNL
ncbi:hypothetical protein GWI33_020729 [Rhynchophorus ferrugineus]|uniref:Uncharacterized protein n=1 Tax=Rhynchophorus ferrugineus TaxID=354439 RepID=A0A834HP59_RHYFE|nr:hypothetical protein GWI33_020729 [Rhynchophorus ferrugineus]